MPRPTKQSVSSRKAHTSKLILGVSKAGLMVWLAGFALFACAPASISLPEKNIPHTPEPTKVKQSEKSPEPFIAGEAAELTPAEPEFFVEQELRRLDSLPDWKPLSGYEEETSSPKYDFPIVVNPQVQFYLDYFQGELRETFARWLVSSGRYVPMIREKLEAAGLPRDLAYLPMIESGYNLTAYSRARAVGPWQFMAPTARQYGLLINDFVDERRDPVRSTEAAIAFLSDLYNEFNCWHLSVAAYNAGGGRIRGAMRRFNSDDFWEIAEKRHLALETRHYVPKLIAAIMISTEPEKYGFSDIVYAPPLSYEIISVPRWTSLEAIADATNTGIEELHNLNRQLRRQLTPPDQQSYKIRLPPGKKQLLAESHEIFTASRPADGFVSHTVQPGESLWSISRRYGLNSQDIAAWNEINNPGRLQAGQELSLFFAQPRETGQGKQAAGSPSKISAKQPPAQLATGANSSRKQTSPPAAANKKDSDRLLVVRAKQSPEESQTSPPVQYYKVRGGDTLWSIARKFRTTTQLIREWNELNTDIIHPGTELILKVSR